MNGTKPTNHLLQRNNRAYDWKIKQLLIFS